VSKTIHCGKVSVCLSGCCRPERSVGTSFPLGLVQRMGPSSALFASYALGLLPIAKDTGGVLRPIKDRPGGGFRIAISQHKWPGMEAKLRYIGDGLMQSRSGLLVDACLIPAGGHAERVVIGPRADRPRTITRR
jgi:hypothetical protein